MQTEKSHTSGQHDPSYCQPRGALGSKGRGLSPSYFSDILLVVHRCSTYFFLKKRMRFVVSIRIQFWTSDSDKPRKWSTNKTSWEFREEHEALQSAAIISTSNSHECEWTTVLAYRFSPSQTLRGTWTEEVFMSPCYLSLPHWPEEAQLGWLWPSPGDHVGLSLLLT